MKNKTIQLVINTMKLSVYICVIHLLALNLLIARDTKGQKTLSVKETVVSVNLKNTSLTNAFKHLESISDYHFNYKGGDINNRKKLDLNFNQALFSDVLLQISRSHKLGFRQLNDVIQVLKFSDVDQDITDMIVADVDITGKITDENGEGLPGASVVVKGTSVGTTTDLDGNYKISVAEQSVLTISFVGYKTEEIAIVSQSIIDIQMEVDAEQLEEIVVVGYGTQKKSDVTGSIASIDGETIARQGTVNASQALQGQVAGVSVVNTSGRPGAGASILIRGQGSYGNTTPLYIVDGTITSDINFIDPNDIKSIEILKDASAAAIYGSRAANGVVIVTTKRGKSGESKITFTANYGSQNLARKLDMASSQQWRDKEVWLYENEGLTVPAGLVAGNFDPSESTDWQDVLFNSAPFQNYNMSFSGGGENNNFNFSVGYANQDGIFVESGYERVNLRLNSDYVAGRFKFGESISLNRTVSRGSNATDRRGFPAPVFAPKDENGVYQVAPDEYGINLAPDLYSANPLAYYEIPDGGGPELNVVANVYGEFEIIDGLFAKVSGNIQVRNGGGKSYTPTYEVGHISNPTANLAESRYERYNYLIENTLNYRKSFAKHKVDAVIGWTRQLATNNDLRLAATGFPEGIKEVSAASEIDQRSSGSSSEDALESQLARLNYSFDGKYLITASVRRDASSRLVKDLRTGVFPSFSLGWIASNESFFSQNNFINNLKFSGGYGVLGRLNSVGTYQVQNTLTFGGNNIDYILGATPYLAGGVSISSITNSNILWERAQTINVAMESSMLDDKIFLNAEYFIKKTEDLQFGAPIPTSVGAIQNSILVNAGDIQNKGVEITLGYQKKTGDFTYRTSLNLYKLQNKVLAFNDTSDVFIGGQFGFAGQNATRAEVGKELSNFWLIRNDGIFQSQSEIDAHSKDGELIQPNAQPGDLRFIDFNDDGVINDDDRQFIDGSIPNLEYGFTFNGTYKNFDFGILFQGVLGGKIFNGVSRSYNNILADQTTDYWSEDNPNAKYFRPSRSDPNGNLSVNDFYLEDSDYLRLKNLSVGYSFPSSVLSKFNINSMRISLTGQNLLTITKFSGYDPENVSFGLDRGVNTFVYPLARTFLMGLTVNF